MNVLRFVERYPDEESCKLDFRLQRETVGIICKKCHCKEHYWLQSKWQWECKSCSFRTTLRSGTIMEASKLPIRTWYLAMVFMSATKKGISAAELQRQLNHKRYDTVWSLMHRIRRGMGARDGLYQLKDSVEFDEGYFSVATPDKGDLKRGKGSQKKQNVGVMAESTPLENIETGKKSRHAGYFKMKVLSTHKSAEVNQKIKDHIDEKTIVFTDKSSSYLDIADYVDIHYSEKSTKESAKETLKWVHIAISNAKRTLLGIYHKVDGKYLQSYLDEFCYKLNRRHFGYSLFHRLVVAMVTPYWYING